MRHRADRNGRGLARDDAPVSGVALARGADGAAAGVSGLCAGLRLYRSAVASGAGSDDAARGDGVGAAGLLVPEHPLAARRRADADLRALSLRLSAGARGVRAAVGERVSGGADARQGAVGGVPEREPADGPAGDRGGRAAHDHGDHRGLRHGGAFRGEDVLDRHLSGVVLDERPGGGVAARVLSVGLRAVSGGAGKGRAGPGQIAHARRDGRAAGAAAAARGGRVDRDRVLSHAGSGRVSASGGDPRADGARVGSERARSAVSALRGQFADAGGDRGGF